MGFSVDMLRGDAGVVDHQLARRSLINEVKKRRISKDSVCDAHPELIRAARNIGEPSKTICPICEEVNVVLVTYVFGHGLPKHGKCVTDASDIDKLRRTGARAAGGTICFGGCLFPVLGPADRRPLADQNFLMGTALRRGPTCT